MSHPHNAKCFFDDQEAGRQFVQSFVCLSFICHLQHLPCGSIYGTDDVTEFSGLAAKECFACEKLL